MVLLSFDCLLRERSLFCGVTHGNTLTCIFNIKFSAYLDVFFYFYYTSDMFVLAFSEVAVLVFSAA